MNFWEILTIGLIAYLIYGAVILIGVIVFFVWFFRRWRQMDREHDEMRRRMRGGRWE